MSIAYEAYSVVNQHRFFWWPMPISYRKLWPMQSCYKIYQSI